MLTLGRSFCVQSIGNTIKIWSTIQKIVNCIFGGSLMKKLLLTLVFTALTTVGAFAQGDGFAVGLGYDRWGYGLVARSGDIQAMLGTGPTGLMIAGDYQLMKGDISAVKDLKWYGGVGANVTLGNDDWNLAFGPRVTAGLLWNVAPQFELFSQVSPTLTIGGDSKYSVLGVTTTLSGFQFAYSAGFRYRL